MPDDNLNIGISGFTDRLSIVKSFNNSNQSGMLKNKIIYYQTSLVIWSSDLNGFLGSCILNYKSNSFQIWAPCKVFKKLSNDLEMPKPRFWQFKINLQSLIFYCCQGSILKTNFWICISSGPNFSETMIFSYARSFYRFKNYFGHIQSFRNQVTYSGHIQIVLEQVQKCIFTTKF